MLRTFACAVVALAIVGFTTAAEKADVKKGRTFNGTIKKIDASTGTLTVSTKVNKEATDKEFKLTDDTKIVVYTGDKKEELKGKDGLKNASFKDGSRVRVMLGEGDKVTEVWVGDIPKKKPTTDK